MNDNLAELAGERKAKEYGERITQLTKEIEKRETEVPAANSAVKKAETEKMNIQEQVHEIKEAINALLMKETQEQYDKLITEKNRLNEDNAALKSNIENALNHIKELNSEISRDYDSHIDNEKTIEERKSIIGKMKEELRKKEAELEKNSTASRLLEEERQRILTKIKNTGEKIDTITNKVEQGERKINEIHLEFSKNEVRLSDLEQEFEEYKEVKPVEGKSLTALKSRFIEIEKEIKSLGAINMKALEDFKEIEKEVNEVAEKANKLETEKNSVVDLIGKIENRKTNVFMECFTKISEKFSEMYYEFFEGQGNLQLSNPERLFDGGLLINAKYKGDKLKSIDAMSGGEKTLTALAFIFAIQDYEAAPFYVLDEADAALDLTNSSKFVKLILNHSKITQFIVVTHNDIITKECDQIIGVAMNKQKSSVIGLRLKGKTV